MVFYELDNGLNINGTEPELFHDVVCKVAGNFFMIKKVNSIFELVMRKGVCLPNIVQKKGVTCISEVPLIEFIGPSIFC